MNFTVDRKHWLRGETCSVLLDSYSNRMCCLGFVCIQMGLSEDDITGKSMPYSLDQSKREKLDTVLTYRSEGISDKGYYLDNSWVSPAANINDELSITNEQREVSLIALFADNGHGLKFTN